MNNDRMIVNLPEALERFGGMKELYDDLATMFIVNNSYSNELLDNLINAGNIKQAAELSHQLKGIAGTLGCEQLFDASKNLNDCLLNKIQGDIKELTEILKNSFTQTITEMKKMYR